MPLVLPDPQFSKSAPLVTETIDAAILVRISRFAAKEPYFGKSGTNRFDDPRTTLARSKRFGTCYLGVDDPHDVSGTTGLICAFAETVLHDRRPHLVEGYHLTEAEVSRYVYRFEPTPLKVAVMHGVDLKNVGGDGQLSTETLDRTNPYETVQAWSLAVYNHHENVDGLLYKSRHTDKLALVIYDRAKRKLKPLSPVEFRLTPGAPLVLSKFKVTVVA